MSLPKYSSPQVISDSIRIVSRRALQLEDGVGDGAALGGEADRMTPERKDVEGLYAKLDKIVSKRLKLKRVLELPDETSLSKKHKARREEGEGKSAGCQQDSMPVGKLTSSSPSQSSRRSFPKFSVWYRNGYHHVSFI